MRGLSGVRGSGHGFPSWGLWALVIPVLVAACGEDDGAQLASVPLTEGQFGALLAGSDGEQLLPVVLRNEHGEPTAVTGAVWMDADGSSMVLDLDPETGLPLKLVFGDFIVLFSNWNEAGTLADVARIYGPTGYIQILRRQPIGVLMPDASSPSGMVTSAVTCLPDCPSKERTQAELLKAAGVGLSMASCGLAAVASWGAMLLPCAGTVVSGARMVTPEDSWLHAPLERAEKLLNGIDILQCGGLDLGSCFSVVLGRAAGEREQAAAREEAYQALVQDANDRLMNGEIQSGWEQGTVPECDNHYKCTPGLTLNCIEGGSKTCLPDCTWSDCPKPSGGGGGSCSVPGDGDSVCAGLIKQVEAQCAASGGRIVGWTKSKAACVAAYKCWANGCPCLFSCGLKCGNDSGCAQSCVTEAGANAQAEAAACAACDTPEVNGQCQTGG